jgi:hypothetical protein
MAQSLQVFCVSTALRTRAPALVPLTVLIQNALKRGRNNWSLRAAQNWACACGQAIWKKFGPYLGYRF